MKVHKWLCDESEQEQKEHNSRNNQQQKIKIINKKMKSHVLMKFFRIVPT
jgi:hypothetical protein